MLFKLKYSYLAGIAALSSCLALTISSPSFAASKDVGAGETIENQYVPTEDYNTINVYDQGIANNTIVGNAGTLSVENGGTANIVTVNSGGTLNVSATGTAADVVINSGAELNVASSGGIINGLTVEDGGYFTLSTDATVTNGSFYGQNGSIVDKTASNIIVSDGSNLNVNNGGTANNTTVKDYSDLTVQQGGTANNTTLEDGGKIIATDRDTTINGLVIKEDGRFKLSNLATVTDMTDSSGQSLGSIQNGKAQNVVVNSGSELLITSSGSATDTVVDGGDMSVNSNSTVIKTTVSNYGELTVSGGGVVINTTVSGNGSVEVGNGGAAVGSVLTGDSETDTATITVNSGGTASNTTLNSYSSMTLEDSGKATGTSVGSGAVLNVNNGRAESTTVNSNGLITNNSEAGTIDGLTINNGGKFNLSTDATVTNANINGTNMGSITDHKAQDFIINNGSTLTVSKDGSANNTTVQDGGTIVATSSGATVDGVTLKTGGQFDFSTDATVNNLTDNNGNKSAASINDKTASGFLVSAGSTLTAAKDGIITETGVSGGTVIAQNGGKIEDTSIGDNGTIKAEDGSIIDKVTIISSTGGKFDFSTNATVTNTNIDGKIITIENKKASGLELSNGSTLTADSGGSATDITVKQGGLLTVNNGATADYVKVNQGNVNVNGGTLSNSAVLSMGQVTAQNGGQVNSTTVDSYGQITLKNSGRSYGVTVDTNGLLTVEQYGSAADSTVKNSGTIEVQNNGQASFTTVDAKGNLNVQNGGSVSNTTVKANGILTTESGANVDSLTANKDAELNLAAGTKLSGNLVMDKDADASGSTLDFSTLFSSGGTAPSTLTLNNGINDAFNGKLINSSTDDKTLNLNGGEYIVSNKGQKGTVQIGGWNMIYLSDGSLRLASDLEMNGTDMKLFINNGANLDVSGTLENVKTVSFGGNLVNSGTIDMTAQGDSSLDELIIKGNYDAETGAQLVINVDSRTNSADKLTINGDVSGKTSVYLKSLSSRVPDGNILFVDAPNNMTGDADSFEIWRVDGSPFTWETLFENNKWYTYVSDADNPTIVPETAAYYGLIDNTFMQTASLAANLRNNISENEFRKTPCRVPRYLKYTNRICRSSRPVLAGWAAPVYSNAAIKSPYNYTASIAGFDGGIDVISNGWSKLGLMASYRNGLYKYENDGHGYRIKNEAETTINSYLAGLYIRHDTSSWSIVGAIYTGILDIDVSSDDGVSADTTGSTYGATLDVNYIYQNINGIKIEPGVRLSYTSVKVDELEDNAGKHTEFDKANRTEVEIGIRFAQRWEFPDAKAEIFVKPSIVKTMNSGNSFELIEERFVDSTEDRTYAKVEAGLTFDMINNWNASLGASYSTGSDYDNISGAFTLRYNF